MNRKKHKLGTDVPDIRQLALELKERGVLSIDLEGLSVREIKKILEEVQKKLENQVI